MNEGESIHRTEIARGNSPEFCRDCKELTGEIEDNTFTAPSPGGYKSYGSKDVFPFCLLLQDECPTNIKWCPKVTIELEKIPLVCRNCDDLIIKSFDDIRCNEKDCEYYGF